MPKQIRRGTPADLPGLGPLAEQFYSASKFLFGFDLERFVATWTQILESGIGVLLLLEGDAGVCGALGGVIYPDINSGAKVATEFFWFVDEASRGGGIRLYREFEWWAREQGCVQIRMAHMLDSMPEKVARFYTRMGFEAAEVHYTKEL